MKKSYPVASRPQSPGSDSDDTEKIHKQQSIVVPTKLFNMADSFFNMADSFEKKDHSWFVSSQIPTDLSIQVQETTFNVHKYPFISRCGYIGQIELQPSISNFGYDLKLDNFPGGSETFEIILKFCYGLPVDLNPKNVAPLRCASEFLEMTEELEDGNLISKTETFLTYVVLASWKDSINVLKSCETLSPWAENLQIVRRCCDSIASKASSTGQMVNEGWWFASVATLRIDHFLRIITAIRVKCLKPEIIGLCIMHYAEKWLPGMDANLERLRGYENGKNKLQASIWSGTREEGGVEYNKEHKLILESLVSILPPQKEAVSCKFLLWMLKMAMVHSVTPALISELEKRVGMVLEDADVNDLLIPRLRNGDQGKLGNTPEERAMHDIDVVQRIMEYSRMYEQKQKHKSGKSDVSKLLDNYLAEIARDPNLSVTKFQVLSETLPENARICHDGLYRAIDIYLKTHPLLAEHEQKRLCKTMDCKKLSLDACMHAAQNDRLPLRTVIQVLFSEQVKMRAEMQGKDGVAGGDNSDHEGSQTSTKMEIKTLKAELERVKMMMSELQRNNSELQHEYEKNKHRNVSSWSLGWRKIKNSAIFHGKVEGGETGGQQRRSNSSRRVSLQRRQTLS